MYGEKMTRWQRFMQRFQLDPIEIVKAELKDALLANLQTISKAEYAALRVKMYTLTADYHFNRGIRLQEFIDEHEFESSEAQPWATAPT